MTEVRLGDPKVAEVSAGQAAPQNMQSFGKSGHPFIRAGSLEFLCSGGSICELEHIEPSVAAEHRLKLFPKHTVVFAKSGMSAKIGRVYRLAEPSYVVSHLAAITPKEKLDSSYLLYFLQANPPAKLIPNDAYPSIRLSEIENIIVQLPLLEEQRRIAAILDKVDAIRRKRQQSLKLIDDLVKSQFIEMFGDPVTNPMGWPRKTLADCLKRIDSGTSLTCESYRRRSNAPAILKLSAVTSGNYNWLENKELPTPLMFDETLEVKAGDLLFSRKNTIELVGMSAYIYDTPPKLMMPDLIFRLITLEKCNKIYLWHLINHPMARGSIAGLASGTASSMPNISKQRLLDFVISLPPLPLQNQFATFVEQADKSKFAMQNQLSEIEILSSALKQKFFA